MRIGQFTETSCSSSSHGRISNEITTSATSFRTKISTIKNSHRKSPNTRNGIRFKVKAIEPELYERCNIVDHT